MPWRAFSSAWESKTPWRRTRSNSACLRTRSKRGVWLLGFAFVVATVPLQIVALHLGSLSQVQPILTAELLFLVILLATWFRFQVGWREWFGCAGAAGGLAGFLIFAQPGGGSDVPTTFEWVVAGSLCGGTALLATLSAFRGPRWWRAAAFGVAGAVGFAFTASLIKTVSNYIVNDWVHMFFHWQTFGAAVCGALSLCVTQNALHAGPIAASQTALVLVDPLVSIALGIGLYGDNLRTAGAYGPLEAISLLIMFVGAASIALSPLVSGMKGEDDRYAGDAVTPLPFEAPHQRCPRGSFAKVISRWAGRRVQSLWSAMPAASSSSTKP